VSESRLTYGSLIVMFVTIAVFALALLTLLEIALTPAEALAGTPVHSPALARLYAAARSFYLTLRYLLTTPHGLLALLAASLVLAAFEVVRER